MTSNSKTTTATSKSAVVFRPFGGTVAAAGVAAGEMCVGVCVGGATAGGGGVMGGGVVGGGGAGGGVGAAPVAAAGGLLGHLDGGMITVAPKFGSAAGRSADSGVIDVPQS